MAKSKEKPFAQFSAADKIKRAYTRSVSPVSKGSNDFYKAISAKDEKALKELFVAGRRLESQVTPDQDFEQTDIAALLFVKDVGFSALRPLLDLSPFEDRYSRSQWLYLNGGAFIKRLYKDLEKEDGQSFSRLYSICEKAGGVEYDNQTQELLQQFNAHFMFQSIMMFCEDSQSVSKKEDPFTLDHLKRILDFCKERFIKHRVFGKEFDILLQLVRTDKVCLETQGVLKNQGYPLQWMDPSVYLLPHTDALKLYLETVNFEGLNRDNYFSSEDQNDTLLIHACRGFAKNTVQREAIRFLTEKITLKQAQKQTRNGENALMALINELWEQRENIQTGKVLVDAQSCLDIIRDFEIKGLRMNEGRDPSKTPLQVLWKGFLQLEEGSILKEIFEMLLKDSVKHLKRTLTIEQRMQNGLGDLLNDIAKAVNSMPDINGQVVSVEEPSRLPAQPSQLDTIASLESAQESDVSMHQMLSPHFKTQAERIKHYEGLWHQMENHNVKMQEMMKIGQALMRQIVEQQQLIDQEATTIMEGKGSIQLEGPSHLNKALQQRLAITKESHQGLELTGELIDAPEPRNTGSRRISNG